MSKRTTSKRKFLFTLLSPLLLSQCVAVNRTPPLSTNLAQEDRLYGGTAFTSGRFQRKHEIIGIIQMDQEGYRTVFFGEVNRRGTDPTQILRTIGLYAQNQGADGIQHFSLIMQNPESEEVGTVKKVGKAMEVAAAIAEGDPLKAALKLGEGEKTNYFVKGELVRWPPEPSKEDTEEDTSEESENTEQ
jgi:hypothetical protein